MLAAAWLFWPAQLGGATTYVTTHGVSMEPGFSTGDLAVLRPADSYEVGDVAAYLSDSLNTVVMHRIVSVEGDRFAFQGDNNDWLDKDHPTSDEVDRRTCSGRSRRAARCSTPSRRRGRWR